MDEQKPKVPTPETAPQQEPEVNAAPPPVPQPQSPPPAADALWGAGVRKSHKDCTPLQELRLPFSSFGE